MTGLTAGAVGIILTAGAGAPAIAGLGTGLVTTVVEGGAAVGTAVATSAGTGAVAGAVTGAATSGSLVAAGTGAAAGACSSAGLTSVAAGIASGPVGWLLLGADTSNHTGQITYDCWKPVLHDDSIEPSKGKLFKDVIEDPRIKQVELGTDNSPITLINVWNEKFEISSLTVPWSGQVVLHATKILSC